MLRFSHVIYYVKDLKKGLSFYESALGIKPRFVHESGTYAELETGATAIAFAAEELARHNLPEGVIPNDLATPPVASEIVFETDEVLILYRKALENGAVDVAAPKEMPWGQTVAYVRDPNGVLIEIASPIAG